MYIIFLKNRFLFINFTTLYLEDGAISDKGKLLQDFDRPFRDTLYMFIFDLY